MVDKSKESLMNFVQSKSKFLELKDGQEATVKYISAEPVITNFQGNPVPSMRFKFEVDGKEIFWDRTAREFAKQMLAFSSGDLLSIKVFGQKNQTKYLIKKINQ